MNISRDQSVFHRTAAGLTRAMSKKRQTEGEHRRREDVSDDDDDTVADQGPSIASSSVRFGSFGYNDSNQLGCRSSPPASTKRATFGTSFRVALYYLMRNALLLCFLNFFSRVFCYLFHSTFAHLLV